ncbi:MAG: single-stranded-DNA-specific exonuclease RecJ [Bacilli bacterium]
MEFLDKLLKHFNLTYEEYLELSKDINEEDLPAVNSFKNIDVIIKRIFKAIENKEKIIIYGDYDCDGIMATTILVKALQKLNADVRYYIPSRYQDGYGLNEKNVISIKDKGYSLIITVDNGISALEAISKAKELGIDVIVTDHHEQIRELPDTPYIMHPIISEYGDIYCCGAYVSFMLSSGLLGYYDSYLLSLASIATISDMMPLKKYNRNIVRLGLKYMNENRYPNIIKLLSNQENNIDENTIGLEIAPKINAIGRMKEDVFSMQRIVRYFLTTNEGDMNELLEWINSINSERKELIKSASESLVYDNNNNPSIIVVSEYKEGLIGLLANKIMNDNNKPTIVLTQSTEDPDILKGSARSKEGFSIANAFDKCKDLLEVYGGHAQAGGLSINKDNLNKFIIKFNEIAINNPFIEKQDNLIEISLNDISKDNYRKYEKLKPFGMDFIKPDFLIKDILTNSLKYTSNNEHISTMITYNSKLLGFNFCKEDISHKNRINVIGNLENNFFRGNETIIFKISKII